MRSFYIFSALFFCSIFVMTRATDADTSDSNGNSNLDFTPAYILGGLSTGASVGFSVTTTTGDRSERKSTYFDQNKQKIRKALTLTRGPETEELLSILEVSEKQRPIAIDRLRKNQDELLNLLESNQKSSQKLSGFRELVVR
jgi:hypothetical protein